MTSLQGKLSALLLALAVAAPASAAREKAFEVEVLRDQAYVAGKDAHERQKIDLYLPRGQKDFPVLLFLHGGGFSKGDRKSVADLGKALAARGVGVAAAGYRLVPDARHPEQSRDAARALAWLLKNLPKYGGDPNQVFIGGHSAGATLAVLVASDEQFLKDAGASPRNVRGIVALSGLYRIPESRKEVFGDERSRNAASAIALARKGLPPVLLAWADKDAPGRDRESREYADALKKVKTEVVTFEAKNRNHGTLLTAIKNADDPTAAEILRFVNSHRQARGTSASR